MGWSSDEPQKTKKGMETSSKILLAIIACLALIIILIIVLLINIQINTFNLSIDTKLKENYDANKLVTKIDDITYINIEEFAELVGYEYHEGEYKAFTIEENKCYVQSTEETASFFLNESKVCKLPVNELESDYRQFTVENEIKSVNGKMYAPIDAINLAFNVVISEEEKSLTVYTLEYLVKFYDAKVIQWGYTSIADQNFENQKSILYGYLIVKKENGLYKIIDTDNTKEIVSDKYASIQFTENTQEFFITNSLGQVGIINLDGTTKIEPIYESISVLDKKSDLYLIQKNEKYGVVKSGNITIIHPEYDKIGLDTKNVTSNIESQYLLLDTLIPVYKENKWGAFNKDGSLTYKLEYDGFGCNLITVEVNGTKKSVEPVITIPDCEGIVVKKAENYGVLDTTGKVIVPIQVNSIYSIEKSDTEEIQYFMIYKNQELNIIQMLIEQGLIENKNNNELKQENSNTVVESNNVITVDINTSTQLSNTISNKVVQ